MKQPIFKIFFFCGYCLLFGYCKPNYYSEELREGDLLFQNLDCGDLCDAIETVTSGVNGKDFSHCAIVVSVNDSLKVLEAIGEKVQLSSLQAFYKRSGDTDKVEHITVARIKEEYAPLISKSVSYAKKQVGVPYDDEFLPDNGKLYCSELLYQSFKHANDNQDFFTLQAMTFKDPATNEFFPAWIDYYQSLNEPIPEGEMGINPGLISRSDKLQIINLETLK